jgi:hypothetical protein
VQAFKPQAESAASGRFSSLRSMPLRSHLSLILDNDRLTRGLDDPEARLLIEWLVGRAETLHAKATSEEHAAAELRRLCARARAIARFVALWCHESTRAGFGPALQLAATERFGWPLPVAPMDACDLMGEILAWESAASTNTRSHE